MRKFLLFIVTAALIAVLAACGGNNDAASNANKDANEGNDTNTEAEAKDYTIDFGVTPWTSTVPPTKVAGLILEEMGYEIAETDADVTSIYVGLSRGDLDVYMDSWMPVHEVHLEKYADDVEDLAVSYDSAASGLVIPTYMDDDIKEAGDLQGLEAEFGNEIFGVESGGSAAEKIDEMIDVYDLDMEQVNSSEGGMLAQALKLMEAEEPVVFYGWRPHSMFTKMDIRMLEDPEEVFNVPSIHVIVSNELKENAPEAYEFLSNWSIPIEDVEDMITKIDDGADETEVAQEWIDNNRDKVDEMIGK